MKFPARRFRRTAASAVLAGALVAVSLTGCSGQGASGDGGSATKGTINWWSWTPTNDVAKGEIAAFNKVYPDIKVIYKKVPIENYAASLKPALASNAGPDVYTVYNSGGFGAQIFAPYATDLTPAVEKLLGADWKSKVYEGGVKAFTIDDRLVAAQYAKAGAGMLWINQNLFDKYKLKPPTTLDEWVAVCKTFRANGLGCFREGIASSGFGADTLHSIMDSYQPGVWADAISGKGKWSDPTVAKSLDLIRTLSKNGILDPGSVGLQQYPDVNNDFLTGKVPMVQMGTWYQQNASLPTLTAALEGAGVSKDTPKITIMPMAFPDVAGKGNPSTVFADVDAGNSVNAKSKQRNAATTFAVWLGHSKAGQQAVTNSLDSLATLDGITPEWDKITLVDPDLQRPALQKVTEQLETATDSRSFGLSAEVSQAIIDALQAVLTSDKSGQDAANDIQSVAEAAQSR
ncbi:ABC transporter substrate-binding protein [Amnibacterium endophyticum]|uniref:ABC transporter substrate-binding protein n=1 Tax=Amnibacterium endophyticum TaxID=2109337 RepID=A0ABW4LAE6_9MICO